MMTHLMLTREQVQAILDMQLRRLTALDRKRLEDEYKELVKTIDHLESLLGDPLKVRAAVKKDTQEHKKQFGDQRRTEILEEEGRKLSREEREPHFDVVVTLSRNGYIKRVPVGTYRLQHRGGKGVTGMTRREDDVVKHMLAVDTHDTLLFFTDRGKVFSLKCYETPRDASRPSRGTPVVNLMPIPKDEHVTAMVAVSDLRQEAWLVLATRLGEIKRTALTRFANIRSSGIIAMDLEPSDELIAVRPATEDSQVMIVTTKGMSVRFPVANLRDRSRTAGGVRAIRLKPEDHVISMGYVDKNRLGVTGGSYGGYMTNWIVTHTDRFKAAVTQRSVSDLSSMFGNSDIGWDIAWEFGGAPWENRNAYLKWSPMTYIENCTTPLLIIHSEFDLRCNIEQGDQMFTALKYLKRDVEYVRFPEEPHGLSRHGRPDRREARLKFIVDWFNKYL